MYPYFVLNLLLKLQLCRYLFIKFKMAAVNPCDFAIARQTFFERRANNFLGSTIITIGSNYQKSWKHLPEKLEATTRKSTTDCVVRPYKTFLNSVKTL